MIKYRCFKNSEEFEKWQENSPGIVVHSIVPIVGGFAMDIDSEGAEATTNIMVFVTYYLQHYITHTPQGEHNA
jgi:hypothetical protein